MAKAYWVSMYRSISNPDAVAAYAKLAAPALTAAGGKFLARGVAAQAYEAGIKERMVVIEFPSVAAAVAAHDSEAYQAALRSSTTRACATSASSKASNSGAAASALLKHDPETCAAVSEKIMLKQEAEGG